MTPEQCRAARAMAGLSQQALADAAKVAKATVTKFERGTRRPYDRTLADIQAALEARGVEFTPDGVRMTRSA